MSMTEELYRAIREDAEPREIQLGEKKYTTAQVFPVKECEPPTLTVTTLTGLVDYIQANVDKHELSALLCHVENPDSVRLYSALIGDHSQRFCYIQAQNNQLHIPLNTFIPAEQFNILIQSCFTEPENRAHATDRGLVLKYSGNVKTVHEGVLQDDGVTQIGTVKNGIASVGDEPMPNPVTLCPFRTFMEVEQPSSQFVFRARNDEDRGVLFSLVEADGGAWKSEAMRSVKAFMEAQVPGLNVIA